MRAIFLGFVLGSFLVAAPRTKLRVPAVVANGDLANIEASIDGQPAKVLRVKGPQDELVILFVLDFTADISAIEAARQAVTGQLNELGPNVWAGVLQAQDGLRVLADPSPDRAATLAAINGYSGGGKAGLLDSVEDAAKLGDRLLEKSAARVNVVYLTDANIYNYRDDYTNPVINSSDSRDLSRRFPDQLVKEKIQKLVDSLQRTETPVSIVQIQNRVDVINEAYQRGLGQMAEGTGGIAVVCRGLTEIPEAINRVMQAVRNQWSITVELPPAKGRSLHVTLVAPDRSIDYRQRFGVRR